jgi:hypothetical protein
MLLKVEETMSMKLRKLIAAALASAGLLAFGVLSTSKAEAADVCPVNPVNQVCLAGPYACPAGAVCLYQYPSFLGSLSAYGGPFYSYGSSAIHGALSSGAYLNNQHTDGGKGAYSQLCTGFNAGCGYALYADNISSMSIANVNLYPIYYVRLYQ